MWGDPEVRSVLRGRTSGIFPWLARFNFRLACTASQHSLQRALKLEPSDTLAVLLLQITGPAHIPHHDPRWLELFQGYDVWVHLELTSFDGGDSSSIVGQAASSLVAHAARTSNLSSFSIHAARMIRELRSYYVTTNSGTRDFATQMSIRHKAKTAAGAMNLLRILIHAVISKMSAGEDPDGDSKKFHAGDIDEVFLYQSRDASHMQATGHDLIDALASFFSSCPLKDTEGSSQPPEMYDATVLALQLFLVLLSSQLYQPMISSFERQAPPPYFWQYLRKQAESMDSSTQHWKPKELLQTFLDWTISRPSAPPRSIAHHNQHLAQSVVQAKGEKLGPDGMYENYLVVQASRQLEKEIEDAQQIARAHKIKPSSSHNILFDATRGVLILSSSIILLPFRLMSLALGLLGPKKGYDEAHRKQLQSHFQSNLTKDTLWLSNSPVADLSSSLLLLLLNSERVDDNPFRAEMKGLIDNRWDTEGSLPNLPDPAFVSAVPSENEESFHLLASPSPVKKDLHLNDIAVNFESLFETFSRTSHNEMGALLLYTLLQASPSFGETTAVRSDLDRIILPLLRTFYFSSSLQHYTSQDYAAKAAGENSASSHLSIRNCPFRSLSQLYVIVILLLIFSQDPSFGSDSFRRIIIPRLTWYKEKNLRDISLGSSLILTLLRMLSFNLKRLHDVFLLSNCCAVLMNLSSSMVDLHDYAAMRLVSTTINCMKRYTALYIENGRADDEDMSSPLGMYSEVTRTLLRVLKDCLSTKNIEQNLQLVYAMMYHQTDFKRQVSTPGAPFSKSETSRLLKVIEKAASILDESGDARTAAKALSILSSKMHLLKEAVSEKKKRSANDDYTFTYEEESDPEIFFVPYVWEVVVCVVTSSSIEWQKNDIKVFPLLEEELPQHEVPSGESRPEVTTIDTFAKNMDDVV